MRRAILCLLAAAMACGAADYDSFGGWTKLKGRKTGFFHTEQIGGRWWLVTPEGNAFLSKGVCHVAYGREAESAPPEPADKRAWAENTGRQLRGWGLNTVGAWSSQEMYGAGLPYTHILDLAVEVQKDIWLKGGVVDVFGSQFHDAVERKAAASCPKFRDDPRLLGYFTDNELRWGPDWRSKESLLESYLKMGHDSAGYKKAAEFMGRRKLTDAAKAEFQEMVAAQYARVSREAILRNDPHHMVLGCRFAGYATEAMLKGVGPYFDVISYNDYSPRAPLEKLREITRLTGKPAMVTEFSFKAMDSGLPNTKGAADPVATQQQRADGFAAYVLDMAALPGWVGYHWFQYRDQPKEGRGLDGENSNYGLVKLDWTTWEVLSKRFIEVNRQLEEVAVKAK